VTPTPNWIVGRETPLSFRTATAFFGVLGYEVDPSSLSDEERSRITEDIAWYKARRELLQFGRFIRLRSPYEGRRDQAAWMALAEDGSRAILAWYRMTARPNPGIERLRVRGLDPSSWYRVTAWPLIDPDPDRANLGLRNGSDLMHFGLFRDVERGYPEPTGDHFARLFEIERQ
jgi:alpha-galactosidase